MGAVSQLAKVYDLDTLDTRFTSSSSVPYQTVIDARSDATACSEAESKTQARRLAQPPKWQTPEFYFYRAAFMVVVPYMFWIAYDVSRASDPRYDKYSEFLSPGWIPGRLVDVSDAQYHAFRGNLPYMLALLLLHPLLRRGWNSVCAMPAWATSVAARGAARLEQRASFDFFFGLVFLFALHGVSAAKVLAILRINYLIATRVPQRYMPAATWIFNVATLFANELCQGYSLAVLARRLAPGSALVRWGEWLDGHGGLVPRWEVLFNITILRLISFNLDYYWSLHACHASSAEKKQLDLANLSERDRITIPAAVSDFGFRNYIAYAIYAPLYLAGPILTFNDYICQLKFRAPSIEPARTARYALRFALALLAMELVLHFDYVGAISKAAPLWSSYSPAQLSLLSFFNLHIIWLKLLLPWRLFRLWALADDLDPPENMVRCVSNNYSTQLFWRAWHRSYNRWLIRYIYVPLGGGGSFASWVDAARSIVTYLLVFTFVALWHDIQLRLLLWGWLIVLFMLPEWIAAWFFPPRRWKGHPTAYRMLCCVGAIANVLMMMAANLVGFAVGLDGLQSIVAGILHDWAGFIFFIVACSCLFIGIQVMFEIREMEKRKGITLKC
ncbi:hypothetical protein CDD82_5348 [Ophiocordyceps australis]|uniref:Uncharacterized protein n=1 Tax=Ophiocordyceps australis TaxID=1399860 RepID=A0A2C5ZRZ0_9HYPO|nr:hypothetical protein CDD82_5348 [Ophiocordyceps australis]